MSVPCLMLGQGIWRRWRAGFLLKRTGSLRPLIFLLLVNGIITVLLGLNFYSKICKQWNWGNSLSFVYYLHVIRLNLQYKVKFIDLYQIFLQLKTLHYTTFLTLLCILYKERWACGNNMSTYLCRSLEISMKSVHTSHLQNPPYLCTI
jgi:hypothetical protein